jgi:hypothetical protein
MHTYSERPKATDFTTYHRVGIETCRKPEDPWICLWLDDSCGERPDRERTYTLTENEARHLAAHLMQRADEIHNARERHNSPKICGACLESFTRAERKASPLIVGSSAFIGPGARYSVVTCPAHK